MKRKTLLVGASVIGVAAIGTTVALEPLGAEPDGEKDCGNVLPDVRAARARGGQAAGPGAALGAEGRGGQRRQLPQPDYCCRSGLAA